MGSELVDRIQTAVPLPFERIQYRSADDIREVDETFRLLDVALLMGDGVRRLNVIVAAGAELPPLEFEGLDGPEPVLWSDVNEPAGESGESANGADP